MFVYLCLCARGRVKFPPCPLLPHPPIAIRRAGLRAACSLPLFSSAILYSPLHTVMPPLAGKPPYATDEPDSVFGPPQQPQRRMLQPAPEDPNNRTSAYDVWVAQFSPVYCCVNIDIDRYDNYIKQNEQATPDNRNSGIGNLLLNMGDDSDDDSDDEDDRRPANPPGITNVSKPLPPSPLSSPSKTAASATAVAVTAPLRSTSQAAQRVQQPQPMAAIPRLPQGGPPSPPRLQQPIAAPRPGYAAPIAALNGQAGAGPGPHVVNARGPPVAPQARPPFAAAPASGSPAPAPHPLQPPITPISPAFIRSSSAASSVSDTIRSSPGVKFSTEKPRPILRGNTEETLLPSRGEKGDDFWRRFSIVAKEPETKDESSWLKKSQNRSNQMSRYVWIIGIFLIVVILGGIGVGIWLSRNSPGHQQPTAIGGSADHSLVGTTSTTMPKVPPTTAGAPTNSIKHISPTNTVKRRALVQPTLVSRHFMKRQNAVR